MHKEQLVEIDALGFKFVTEAIAYAVTRDLNSFINGIFYEIIKPIHIYDNVYNCHIVLSVKNNLCIDTCNIIQVEYENQLYWVIDWRWHLKNQKENNHE